MFTTERLQKPATLNSPDDMRAKLTALDKSQAVIEFDPSGKILTANRNFLSALGYSLEEIQGKHHEMFVEPAFRASPEYRAFWDNLRRGEFQAAQFKRIGKGGKEVWIEASYNPILDRAGKVYKVVKFATDVSAQKQEYADLRGQLDAIGKSQAVIEFDLNGQILTANDNFLKVMGYTLNEIQGKQHGIFVEPAYRNSPDYRAFWDNLRRGEYQAAQFKRIGKGGKEVWIEASYNPINDLNGRPFKVVKYATDVTRQIELMGQLRAIIDKNFGEIDGAIGSLREITQNASRATSETSSNVNTVAAATEEMTASIQEISQRMSQSRSASDSAQQNTDTADEATRRLSKSADAMSGIVQIIQEIASQINLLALNATIESARAGEAGRGFAVVASEVKSLASQAASATARISTEIEGIQAVSNDVVSALGAIKGSIASLKEYVEATAVAVEEQASVTQDVSSNMSSASGAVANIETSMTDVSSAIELTSAAIESTREAARVLAR
jgi:methyl-accepting chemotaxis protein